MNVCRVVFHQGQTIGKRVRYVLMGSFILVVCAIIFAHIPLSVKAQLTESSSFTPDWSSQETDNTQSVAWGDYDNDGDLDLVVGNFDQPNRLYRNDDGILSSTAVWSSQEADYTQSVAWGDYDNDGDLDLVVGNFDQPNRLYRNDDGILSSTAVWSSQEADYTQSVAWGDYDNDGDLDLIVGNGDYSAYDIDYNTLEPIVTGEANRLYHNTNGMLAQNASWSSREKDVTSDIAWGDYDNDGDLDFAVSNYGHPSRVYHNEKNVFTRWDFPEELFATSLAWADYDNDGYLDLVIGTGAFIHNNPNYASNRLYRYTGVDEDMKPNFQAVDDWYIGGAMTHSVAWGDYNNDGTLDVVMGTDSFTSNEVYSNIFGILDTEPSWQSVIPDSTRSVAWGDVDNDGDLDLAVGNRGQANRVYRNNEGILSDTFSDYLTDPSYSRVAWGDVDNDGDLDLAAGKESDESTFVYYTNHAASEEEITYWQSAEDDGLTTSVEWGDVDGDNDLDLLVGNDDAPNRLYRNCTIKQAHDECAGVPSGLKPQAVWSFAADDATQDLVWGDVDGDGDLDLAVGNANQPNRLYRNDQGTLTPQPVWETVERDHTTSLAWGDMDGDGDLDLVVGNANQPNRLYRNDQGTLTPQPVWETVERDHTTSLAWGDMDGDGDLDLVVGNTDHPNRVYHNTIGLLSSQATWTSIRSDRTQSITVADVDGDSDLDVTTINFNQPNLLYFNHQGNLSEQRLLPFGIGGTDAAWGDYDNDGDLDIAYTSFNDQDLWWNELVIQSNVRDRRTSQSPIPTIYIDPPEPTMYGDHNSSTYIHPGPIISFSYTLTHPQSHGVQHIIGEYSLNGGGHWQPAIATPDTQTTQLSTSPQGTTYTYTWDVFGSGMMGQSDTVVFRLRAIPAIERSQIPGPYLQGSHATQTMPFRVRGTQVQVVRDEPPPTIPEPPSGAYRTWLPLIAHQPTEARAIANEGAIVYRLSEEQKRATVISDHTGRPYRADQQGYLQGRGMLQEGDQLIALAPIAATDTYTIYLTNATPTATGLDTHIVQEPGIQQLTVSRDNPLVVFNLTISLEWDARTDTQFLSQLDYDLQRASELLYDWTNGQAVLGQLTVYQNKEHWDAADIRIYASNRVRPNAAQGGVVSSVRRDPDTSQVVYAPGQVRMGANWNRYGDPSGTLGEDWPRALTHELGHYLFHLDDNYLGMDEQGRLITVDTCPGAMSDPYRDDYSEFHPGADWLPTCQTTLSQRSTERSDWETITTFFPWLHAPDTAFGSLNSGPNQLPLAITQIINAPMTTPTEPLDVPIFNLTNGGERVIPSAQARAFLFRDTQIVDLGRPVLDQVHARGALVGDRLCVYDLAASSSQMGCEIIRENDEQVALVTVPDWQPVVQVNLVTARTLDITVTQVDLPGHTLYAQLIPATTTEQDLLPAQPLTSTTAGHTTQFANLEKPVLEGFIHVWVDEPGPRREIISDFTLGGGPARIAIGGRGPAHQRSRSAPAISADGQVILFTDDPDVDKQPFYALQAAPVLPNTPPWATVIGSGYHVTTTAGASPLSRTSITFHYLGGMVPPNEEDRDWLRVYFWDGQSWQPLDTYLDTYYNIASATAAQPGLYALMSSIEIPVTPGWNLIAYPIKETRTVAQALLSLTGNYTAVYGFDGTKPHNPWRVYQVDQPDEQNTLRELHFGQGYFVCVKHASTLRLKGPPMQTTAQTAETMSLQPPNAACPYATAAQDPPPEQAAPQR